MATNHVLGIVAQEIDVLSFQNNGEPYEMADDAIIPVADVCVWEEGKQRWLEEMQNAPDTGIQLDPRAGSFNQHQMSWNIYTYTHTYTHSLRSSNQTSYTHPHLLQLPRQSCQCVLCSFPDYSLYSIYIKSSSVVCC